MILSCCIFTVLLGFIWCYEYEKTCRCNVVNNLLLFDRHIYYYDSILTLYSQRIVAGWYNCTIHLKNISTSKMQPCQREAYSSCQKPSTQTAYSCLYSPSSSKESGQHGLLWLKPPKIWQIPKRKPESETQVGRRVNVNSHTLKKVCHEDSGGNKNSLVLTKTQRSYTKSQPLYLATTNTRTVSIDKKLLELEEKLKNIKWDI